MPSLSTADHRASPPRIHVPRDYNAAHDLIERNLAAGRAAKTAYIDDAGAYTYGDLAERVNRCANALIALGLRPEERVLLCHLDTIDFPAVFLGAIKAGIVPIAANTLLTTADYDYMLRDSRARALVVSAPLLPAFAPILAKHSNLSRIIVSGAVGEEASAPHLSLAMLMAAASPSFAAAETTCDDACFWLYSSGSTGSPKGTVHLHSSLVQTAELYAKPVLGIREDDVVFSAAKLFFAYGLGNALTFPLAVGATAVLMAERPTPAAVFSAIEEGPAHDFLRRAHALRRASRLPRCAEARSARSAALCFGRRGAAGGNRPQVDRALRHRHSRRPRFDGNAAHLPFESPGRSPLRDQRHAGSWLRR